MEDHRIFLRPPVWLPIIIALILGGSFIVGKKVETRHQSQRSVSVQGEGKVSAVPDIAQLSFGVQTGRQKSADRAMDILTKKINDIMGAVQAAGVEEKDVRTQNLSLNPAYDWNEGRRIDRGYEANQSLMVKVRDLSRISDVLDAAVSAGANQAGSVSFTIDDPEELRAQARKAAIADAKSKAEVLEGQLGVSFGEMTSFHEEGGMPPPMPYRSMAVAEMAMGTGGGGVPLPAGEQEIVVRVNLTYKLDD